MSGYFGRKTFGVLLDCSDTGSSYQRITMRGIQRYAQKNDINLLFLAVGRLDSPLEWEQGKQHLYDFIVNKSLFDGFIIVSSSLANFSGMKPLEEKLRCIEDFPKVSISGKLAGTPLISIDNCRGFEEIILHLINDHPYKRIAFVSGPKENPEALIRLEKFRNVMKENHREMDERLIYHGDFLIKSGQEAGYYFLEKIKERPDAIICANDDMAMGVFQAMRKKGLSMPEDIALTGFDDLQTSNLLDLPFTTVRQPFFEEGYRAAETLDRILNKEFVPEVQYLPGKVVYRHSCGCSFIEQKRKNGLSKDSGDQFFQEQKQVLAKALALEIQGAPGNPLLRAWNHILSKAIRNSVKQSVLQNLLLQLQEMITHEFLSNSTLGNLSNKLISMNLMFTEYYTQEDLTSRWDAGLIVNNTIVAIENWGSTTEKAKSQEINFTDISTIFRAANINTCYISTFDNSLEESALEYCYIDKENIPFDSGDAGFQTKLFIPKKYIPKDRFDLTVELLFEGRERLGMLIFSTDIVGLNVYDMLRSKISSIIKSRKNNDHLRAVNNKLQKEIQMRKKTESELKKALRAVESLSLSDELTGLYNRRGFLTMGEQQYKYCIREKISFIILFIDLDGLKQINDVYGHKEGDFAINTIGSILQESLRETDIISRLGGDEFTVFASNVNKVPVKTLIDRIVQNVSKKNLALHKPYQLSISIGSCTNCSTDNALTLQEMMDVADVKLYQSKRKKKQSRF